MVATVLAGAAGYLIEISPSHAIRGTIRTSSPDSVLAPAEREQVVQSLRAVADRPDGPLSRPDRQVLSGILDGQTDTEIMDRLRLTRPDLDHQPLSRSSTSLACRPPRVIVAHRDPQRSPRSPTRTPP